jgi:tRNA (cytidine32/uridine32-2'-O)-methyltransferase
MFPTIRIVLVNTSHPGNIGAAARAMKNMGLSRLYLVNPQDFPSFEASQRAAWAGDLLQQAVVVDSLQQALQGCALAVATSARLRSVQWQQINARACGELLVAESAQHEVALVFGAERTGLTNEELEQCQVLVHIPTDSDYASINLAQAVQILCYEILMAGQKNIPPAHAEEDVHKLDKPATAEELEGLFGHWLQTFQQLEFFGERNPEIVMRRLRSLFARARPSLREVQILRGMLTAARGKKKPGNQ